DRLEPPRNDAPVGNLVMKRGCVVVSVIARGWKDVKFWERVHKPQSTLFVMRRNCEGRTRAISYNTKLTRPAAIIIIWNRNPIERLLRRRLALSEPMDRLEPPRNDAPVGNLVINVTAWSSPSLRGARKVLHLRKTLIAPKQS